MKEWKTLSLGRDLSPEEIEKAIEEALNEATSDIELPENFKPSNWI
jgi:7-cyano-7-deazaguanine synthase